ncbi:CDGSH iron-sulfur domain-containing protein [Streptomyces triticagri]|uniref:CDGSH iron-sulfur domain-containing protein n=1 Tax=Streptomyces triticagri TaxID=2293568 RepID=A0A372M1B0_9ACTN|nr:CDGSH iron-sulfur domain-containing protein [Streptomyces triticagri]RFU84609.1 CDGSH iron-sulfur domain-containing protein [Streptomyces triticagri]
MRTTRRVWAEEDGPLLVEGPVEFRLADGTSVVSDRFVVAVCTCRRSAAYPWCDTTHRHLQRRQDADSGRTEGS